MRPIIEIKNLEKSFGDIKAVDDISFTVKRGSLFAFLGLNGAGKSTTINILCSILSKDNGKVYINGYDLDNDVEKIKKDIGIVFQNSILDERLTVKDNLTVRASYYGLRKDVWKNKLQELTRLLDLEDILKRPFGKLSGGQKRRVDIARGLINNPKILFLDEPTTGLDPKTRQTVWKILNDLRRKNDMTIFLTTHYMEEANKADKVVIMDSGKIVANNTPNILKNEYSGDYIKIYMPNSKNFTKKLQDEKMSFAYCNESYIIKFNNMELVKNFLIKNLEILKDFEIVKGDMDDVFLNVTGKILTEETNGK